MFEALWELNICWRPFMKSFLLTFLPKNLVWNYISQSTFKWQFAGIGEYLCVFLQPKLEH